MVHASYIVAVDLWCVLTGWPRYFLWLATQAMNKRAEQELSELRVSLAEWEATARRRGTAAERAEGRLKQSVHSVRARIFGSE